MRRLTLEPGVDPAIAAVLVRDAADAMAADSADGSGADVLVVDAEPASDELDAAVQGAGLVLTRTLLQMRRSLPVPPGDRGPSGAPVPLRAFRPGVDDDAWLAVNNRAFAWHPEQSGWTGAELAERMTEPWFRADGFLVHDGPAGAIDGFCWTKIHADHDPPLGEIYVIGVDPDAHGRGLGRALTLGGLDWLADHGLTIGMLYVEADNDAAVGLYRDLGFTEHLAHRWWQTPV
jgi:mycothiol synthase